MSTINTYILRELVKRIRSECPLLENRVGPAADYSNQLFENTSIPIPHATVIPLMENGQDKNGIFLQADRQTFAVVVCVENKTRRLEGQDLTPYDSLKAIREQLDAALLNWKPAEQENQIDEMIFAKGYLLKETEARIWYQYEYQTQTYVWGVSAIGNLEDSDSDINIDDLDYLYYAYVRKGQDGTVPAEDYELLEEFLEEGDESRF